MLFVVDRVSLEDLYRTALIRIGNYLVEEELRSKEFPFEKFVELFKNQIYPLYTKYVYKRGFVNVYVTYGSPYRFPDPAPEFVCRVVPVSVYGLYIGEFLNFRFLSHVSYLSTKPLSRFCLVWRYEKPNLYIGYQGEVEIKAGWRLQYDDERKEVEVDPDTRDILQDLCSAYVMIAVGRSRRAVRIADNNLEFDAGEMVAEGEELLRETRERLINVASLETLNF